MSEFSKYAVKVNEIAKAAFAKYRMAADGMKFAEEMRRKYPQQAGLVNAEYAAQSARVYADYLTAKESMKRAQEEFSSHNSEIAALRRQLAADLNAHYAADPAALDANTLELLKSGVLTPAEYSRLLNKAQTEGNFTMARVIAKYAGDAAASMNQQDPRARELRAISYTASANNGSNILAAFDMMADVYRRATLNPHMIDSWDDLTGEVANMM